MYKYPSYNQRDLDEDFPHFEYPKIVGGFSLDASRNFVHDQSQLQFLKPEKEILGTSKDYDLNVGFKDRVDRGLERMHHPEYLNNIFTWILANKPTESQTQFFGVDFITFRGLIRLIMKTPYERKDGWILRIMKWKDTIFICEEKTEAKKNEEINRTEKEKRPFYWGYKFEDYMTNTRGSTESKESKLNQTVEENSEFNCIFKSKVGKLRIMYGAEMDAYEPTPETVPEHSNINLQPSKFTELKTSKNIMHPGQERSLRQFKFLTWWAQCFLVGTENVIVGWKDDRGVVSNVQKISVKEMSRSALNWKGNVCFNFLLDVLKFLKANILDDSLTQVYRLTFCPNNGFTMKIEDGTEPFIPDWFHSQFK